jgi:parvulin-like peptidyl-prolyl isomerase
MDWVRERFGTFLTSLIIGFIAFIFVVTGFFSPKATRGLHEGAVAGTVNGDSISISEFNRALNQRMEMFKSFGGGKLTDEQLKAFHIRDGVFQELVRRKLMEQEAVKQGLEASDEEVMDRIREIPAFQKDGKFDVATYKQTLEANNYTAGTFERMVRTDLSAQAWQNYFQNRVKVSETELRQQYQLNEDKRDIKYVLLTNENGRHGIKVPQADVDKFLADTAKVNLAKSQFEAKKNKDYKSMTFDMVKNEIARDLLAGEKAEEIRKINDKLADQVMAMLSAGKAGDAKVNALLKPYKAEVKTTGMVTSEAKYLQGLGEAPELLKDAFAAKSPIDPAQGGKAKKFNLPAGIAVAVVTESKQPDMAKYDSERGNLIRQIAGKKQRDIYEEWLKRVQAKAKIDANPQVVDGDNS